MTDIVKRLREFVGQYLGNANLDDELTEAADEIVQMREGMVKIMWLLTRGPDRTRDIMAIINPWILKHATYLNARPALKESE